MVTPLEVGIIGLKDDANEGAKTEEAAPVATAPVATTPVATATNATEQGAAAVSNGVSAVIAAAAEQGADAASNGVSAVIAAAAATEAIPMAVDVDVEGGCVDASVDNNNNDSVAAATEAIPMAVDVGSVDASVANNDSVAAATEAIPMAVEGVDVGASVDNIDSVAVTTEAIPIAVEGVGIDASVENNDSGGGDGDGENEAKAQDDGTNTADGKLSQTSQIHQYQRAYRSEERKRPRPDEDEDPMEDLADPSDSASGPNHDVQQAILKFKRKKGTCYDVTYDDDESSLTGRGTEYPYGIQLAAVKVKSANSYLSHYYERALGEKYRGRPPSASDQAIIVRGIAEGGASPTTMANVRRNDIFLFLDDKLVNITDKKRLKYYKARLNNGSRPMKLTFFRPAEEEEEPDDEEEMDLDSDEGCYISKFVPAEETTAGTSSSYIKPKSPAMSREERQARRTRLERRLEELDILHVETSTELADLRAQDGILAAGGNVAEPSEPKIPVTSKDDFVIPSHIMYYPPMKLRRKKLRSLHEACNKVENILRQRYVISREAEKIRGVVQQGQLRLATKDKQLEALDETIAPELEQVKFIEMEVQDNWKTMYLKLKNYFEENGHSNVMEKEDTKLAKWVTRQRTCFANSHLEAPNASMGIIKPYQYDLLNRLEFCWNPREQQFIQNVTLLKVYKQQHGHTNVPMKFENLHLANFVQKWRREYRLFSEGKPSNMSQDRLQVLEEAGFTWRDPSRTRKRSDTRQETWDGFLSQLEAFKDKYGHFMVNKVNKSLEKGNRLHRLDEFCGWVRKQYTLYKEGSPCQLTDDKVSQLRNMGFWLERGQSHRYAQEMKVANSNNGDTTPQEEDTVQQLGQLQVPKMDEIVGNSETAENEGGDEEKVEAHDWQTPKIKMLKILNQVKEP